jgi:hypothetical protein
MLNAEPGLPPRHDWRPEREGGDVVSVSELGRKGQLDFGPIVGPLSGVTSVGRLRLVLAGRGGRCFNWQARTQVKGGYPSAGSLPDRQGGGGSCWRYPTPRPGRGVRRPGTSLQNAPMSHAKRERCRMLHFTTSSIALQTVSKT